MPRVRVHLPRALLQFWDGARVVEVDAPDLAAAIRRVGERHPGLDARIVDEQGRVRAFVNVFLNQVAVRDAPSLVALKDGDVVHVLPSVAGG